MLYLTLMWHFNIQITDKKKTLLAANSSKKHQIMYKIYTYTG